MIVNYRVNKITDGYNSPKSSVIASGQRIKVGDIIGMDGLDIIDGLKNNRGGTIFIIKDKKRIKMSKLTLKKLELIPYTDLRKK